VLDSQNPSIAVISKKNVRKEYTMMPPIGASFLGRISLDAIGPTED
jgi:hypothetical protein